jgi:hypothetical protein
MFRYQNKNNENLRSSLNRSEVGMLSPKEKLLEERKIKNLRISDYYKDKKVNFRAQSTKIGSTKRTNDKIESSG